MIQHAAFLRAVNVGGRASVRMGDLCRVFSEAGCEEVRTAIQSGNVLLKRNLDVFVVSRLLRKGMYGFPNAFVESAFGVPATSRNFNTVRRTARRCKDGPAAASRRFSPKKEAA